jgi:hypothetical protein
MTNLDRGVSQRSRRYTVPLAFFTWVCSVALSLN